MTGAGSAATTPGRRRRRASAAVPSCRLRRQASAAVRIRASSLTPATAWLPGSGSRWWASRYCCSSWPRLPTSESGSTALSPAGSPSTGPSGLTFWREERRQPLRRHCLGRDHGDVDLLDARGSIFGHTAILHGRRSPCPSMLWRSRIPPGVERDAGDKAGHEELRRRPGGLTSTLVSPAGRPAARARERRSRICVHPVRAAIAFRMRSLPSARRAYPPRPSRCSADAEFAADYVDTSPGDAPTGRSALSVVRYEHATRRLTAGRSAEVDRAGRD